jgi:hypothetical protein
VLDQKLFAHTDLTGLLVDNPSMNFQDKTPSTAACLSKRGVNAKAMIYVSSQTLYPCTLAVQRT